MTSVTFRFATEKDKRVFPWKREGVNQARPAVVTINGHVVLMMHGERVIYQRSDLLGSETIADLIRAKGRVFRALQNMPYEGSSAVRKRGRESELSPDYEDPFAKLRDLINGGR